ncbi:MAG: hypothetical protein GF411_01725, partial [Candidatus Lokiarchaeota archaeon]|nr:hypothetical protein [Candidatus Woesearchaeota archaeon]MBD3404838.1 hypothetical protein [Candidatus Lokiarchaeota archaeon]
MTGNKMKKTIILLLSVFSILLFSGIAYATSCSVAASDTAVIGADEDISLTCSEIGSGNTVTIEPSGFSTQCITLDSASKQVSTSSPTTTFSVTGVSMSCSLSVSDRTVDWTFTHSGGNSIASKSTVYNVVPMPSITPSFDEPVYSASNDSSNVTVTLALTTSQSEVDIRNIELLLTTSFNGTELENIAGLENKTQENGTSITIDVSESTTQYVTWNLELPPLPPGSTYDFNVSLTSDNANPTMATALINVSSGGGETTIEYTYGTAESWYLISIPVGLDDSSVSSVFSDMNDFYELWQWDADSQSWEGYFKGFPGNDFSNVNAS